MCSVKSNINDATFGELYLTNLLSRHYKKPFIFAEDIEKTVNLIHISHPKTHRDRIVKQKNRVTLSVNTLINKLDKIVSHRETEISEILWVGNKNRGSKVADIEITFSDKFKKPFSLKSGGLNTERNIGSRSLKKYTGIDIKKDNQNLLKSALKVVKKYSDIEIKGITSLAALRKVLKSEGEQPLLMDKIKSNGYKEIKKLSQSLLRQLEELPFNKKLEFTKFASGQNLENNIEILIMEDKEAYFKPKLNLENINEITFSLLKDDSTTIILSLNRKPTFRININNTNGIGQSPYALRVFTATGA